MNAIKNAANFFKNNLAGIFISGVLASLAASYLFGWLTAKPPVALLSGNTTQNIITIKQPVQSIPDNLLPGTTAPMTSPNSSMELGTKPQASDNVPSPSATSGPDKDAPSSSQTPSPEQAKLRPPAEPDGNISVAPVEAPHPKSAERYGISIVLDGLTETETRYIATIRIVNSNATDTNIAMLSGGAFRAEFFLTDSSGGSCQMAANGEGWGSLNAIDEHTFTPHFAIVPSLGEARHFLFFNKRRCDSKLAERNGISLNGTFVIGNRGQLSYLPVSFSDLTMKEKMDN